MTQIKEESLKQMYKYIQREGMSTKFTDLCVLCIVIRNVKVSRYLIEFSKIWSPSPKFGQFKLFFLNQ